MVEGTERKRILVVVNPASGRNRLKDTMTAIQSAMSARQLEYDIRVTSKQGDAVNLVQSVSEKVYDTVCVAGGDGTINEVVNGLYGKRKLKLGIIPIGTVNVLALQLGLPFSIRKAVDVLAKGHSRRIDLVTADNRLFVLMAGIGFDAYAIYKTDMNIKKFFGRLAYVLSALRALLRRRPGRLDVIIDKKTRDNAYFMLISNVSIYGGRFPLMPDAKIDDGRIDVMLFKNRDNLSLITYFAAFITGRARSIPFVSYYQARCLEVRARENILVHTDAELAGTLPMSFSVLPRAIEVVVP
jgi:diacylglycerol kinase (ATP)